MGLFSRPKLSKCRCYVQWLVSQHTRSVTNKPGSLTAGCQNDEIDILAVDKTSSLPNVNRIDRHISNYKPLFDYQQISVPKRNVFTLSRSSWWGNDNVDLSKLLRFRSLLTRCKHGARMETDQESNKFDSDSSSSDSDSDVDNDEDDDEIYYAEDKGFPSTYKDINATVKSLRVDGIVSHGLNIARNKVEDYFLGSKLRFNGEKLLKKSKKMQVGDCVDLISSVEPEGKLKVKRVRLLHYEKAKNSSDKVLIKLRTWRGNVLIDDPKAENWEPPTRK